jgi:predicted Zn-dependent protease
MGRVSHAICKLNRSVVIRSGGCSCWSSCSGFKPGIRADDTPAEARLRARRRARTRANNKAISAGSLAAAIGRTLTMFSQSPPQRSLGWGARAGARARVPDPTSAQNGGPAEARRRARRRAHTRANNKAISAGSSQAAIRGRLAMLRRSPPQRSLVWGARAGLRARVGTQPLSYVTRR